MKILAITHWTGREILASALCLVVFVRFHDGLFIRFHPKSSNAKPRSRQLAGRVSVAKGVQSSSLGVRGVGVRAEAGRVRICVAKPGGDGLWT